MAVYRSTRRVIQCWFAVATLVMLGAFGGLFITAQSLQPVDIYLAVTCGIVIWGWLIAAYYLDFVTGPLTAAQPTSAADLVTAPAHTESDWAPLGHFFSKRFRLALRTTLYHELLVLGVGLLMAAVTLPQTNRWGLWIFVVLWFMHTSAKLNVFFGVRNFRVDFLPTHLHHLDHLLVKRSSNAFFPLSICLASSVTLGLFYQAIAPSATADQMIGSLLLLTMLVLGIIEHWLLILPLPAILWGWGVRKLPPPDVPEFTLAEVPLPNWPVLDPPMTQLRRLALYRMARTRRSAAIRALSKQVMES
jgi:putative photosynthetic complex assembly protein 2